MNTCRAHGLPPEPLPMPDSVADPPAPPLQICCSENQKTEDFRRESRQFAADSLQMQRNIAGEPSVSTAFVPSLSGTSSKSSNGGESSPIRLRRWALRGHSASSIEG